MRLRFGCFLICLLGFGITAIAEPVSGIAMHGTPKYTDNFQHFDYVNPDAPKGGTLRQVSLSSFDTFNPFTIIGVSAPGVGLLYDTLMKQSQDEPFSLYGLVAERIDIAKDRSRVTFDLNPKARFSDGTPITSKDVVFSFECLRDKGLPMYRAYYRDVVSVSAPDSQTVIFHLPSNGNNRELPLILGELPILPHHFWENRNWETTSLEPPIGSGPYIIDSVEAGRSVTYRRNPNYWASDLNVNKGSYNFDTIRFDVYRDTTVAAEAFMAGLVDIRFENEAKKWASSLQSEAVQSGKIIARSFPHHLPSGMQGFVFNVRRPIFQNIKVREALAHAFDFDWVNQHLFHNAYRRTNSFFDNSFLAAKNTPSPEELALLEPFRNILPPSVFDTIYRAPQPEQSNIRPSLERALSLLSEAGWHVQNGRLTNANGDLFQFEILIDAPSAGTWERVIQPFVDRLRRLGIQATIRTVDAIQYKTRLDQFDFDMIVSVWGQSLSPGNEQRYYWGTISADTTGSLNYAGLKNPAVDALIEKIVQSETTEQLVTAVRALDRVLLFSHIVIPHWHMPEHRYLYHAHIGVPTTIPMKGADPMTWWYRTETENLKK